MQQFFWSILYHSLRPTLFSLYSRHKYFKTLQQASGWNSAWAQYTNNEIFKSIHSVIDEAGNKIRNIITEVETSPDLRLTSYPHWGNLVGNQGSLNRAICYIWANHLIKVSTLAIFRTTLKINIPPLRSTDIGNGTPIHNTY